MRLLNVIRSNYRINQLYRTSALVNGSTKFRNATTKTVAVENNENDLDKPIKYTTSEAASWKARSSRLQGSDEQLWYQTYVVVFSVATFLIYFCILREENDIDQELNRSLYERVPDLERQHLLQLHQKYLDDGKDVKAIEKRLKEILDK